MFDFVEKSFPQPGNVHANLGYCGVADADMGGFSLGNGSARRSIFEDLVVEDRAGWGKESGGGRKVMGIDAIGVMNSYIEGFLSLSSRPFKPMYIFDILKIILCRAESWFIKTGVKEIEDWARPLGQ